MTPPTLDTSASIATLMTHNPVCADPAASARELAQLLDQNGISGVPVVDANDRLIGVVSRTDIIRQCVEGPLRSDDGSLAWALSEHAGDQIDEEELGTVTDLMNPEPIVGTPDESIATIAKRMHDERVHRIIIIDGQVRPTGIVTSLDMLRIHFSSD